MNENPDKPKQGFPTLTPENINEFLAEKTGDFPGGIVVEAGARTTPVVARLAAASPDILFIAQDIDILCPLFTKFPGDNPP